MTDEPPPYADRYVGFIRATPQPVQKIQVSSVTTFEHRQDGYLTYITSPDQSFSTLHFLASTSEPIDKPPISTWFSIDASLEDLKIVQSFRERGTFVLSQPKTSDDGEMVLVQMAHVKLMHLLSKSYTQLRQQQDRGLEGETQPLDRNVSITYELLDSVQSPESSNESPVAVKVYSIDVFTESTNTFTEPDAAASSLLFKWAKPQSNYGHMSGHWQTSLAAVMEDGVFKGGHDLMLLVRKLSAQQMQSFQERCASGSRQF